MKDQIPSRTALRVALRRAAHQLQDHPKVLDDPLAVRIVGEGSEHLKVHLAASSNRIGRSLSAFLVARSKFAEEKLAEGIVNGVQQYIVLGAGLDTSAYRGIVAETGIKVFEVDHPATQNWKKERLLKAEIAIPQNVNHVPVDFEKNSLVEELTNSGFRADRMTFISWLGVVPYLTREAASHTLRFIGGLPSGSGVTFDYAVALSSLNLLERISVRALAKRVASVGEPFRLFFEPEELRNFLRERGFSRIEQLDSQQINERYFKGRNDGLRVMGRAGRIVVAWT
jgi:methyltransferase (TIGR00027 family)